MLCVLCDYKIVIAWPMLKLSNGFKTVQVSFLIAVSRVLALETSFYILQDYLRDQPCYYYRSGVVDYVQKLQMLEVSTDNADHIEILDCH